MHIVELERGHAVIASDHVAQVAHVALLIAGGAVGLVVGVEVRTWLRKKLG